jgi:hypothetical protein
VAAALGGGVDGAVAARCPPSPLARGTCIIGVFLLFLLSSPAYHPWGLGGWCCLGLEEGDRGSLLSPFRLVSLSQPQLGPEIEQRQCGGACDSAQIPDPASISRRGGRARSGKGKGGRETMMVGGTWFFFLLLESLNE